MWSIRKKIMNSVGEQSASVVRRMWQVNSVQRRNWALAVFAISTYVSRTLIDREFCYMQFAANRLVSHLESCNTWNWSTNRAKFQFRLLFPEYNLPRSLNSYGKYSAECSQLSWQCDLFHHKMVPKYLENFVTLQFEGENAVSVLIFRI